MMIPPHQPLVRLVAGWLNMLCSNRNPAPKLSATMAIVARETSLHTKPRDKIIRLYRHVQKQVPYLLSVFGIDEPTANVRSNIKKVFAAHGTTALEPRISNMLIFKGQIELDEALAQWKTRTHIQKYVYDISSKPHLGRSSLADTPMSAEMLAQPEALKRFLAEDPKSSPGW